MTPAQCRAARALLNITQAGLAKLAGVGLSTVADFELQRREVSADSLQKMEKMLEACGVEFINGKRQGVMMKA